MICRQQLRANSLTFLPEVIIKRLASLTSTLLKPPAIWRNSNNFQEVSMTWLVFRNKKIRLEKMESIRSRKLIWRLFNIWDSIHFLQILMDMMKLCFLNRKNRLLFKLFPSRKKQDLWLRNLQAKNRKMINLKKWSKNLSIRMVWWKTRIIRLRRFLKKY